jgi:imidazolonepropionase-like amidohydrolase
MRGSSGVLAFREQVASGELLGPRIVAASPILGNASPDPKDYESGVALVEQFAKEGYDFIKVYNQIPAEGYRGVMDAADRLGIPVIGHAVRSVGIEGAIERGQHIAHMEEIIYGYFKNDLDESKIAPLAKRLKEADIAVVATLIAYHTIIRQVRDIDAVLQSEGIELLPEPLTRAWQRERNDYVKRFTREAADERLQPAFDFQQKLAKAFQEAGIRLLAGTDAGIPIVVAGFSLHLELVELVDAGLTPYEALAVATRRPAEFLKLADSGTIETGKRADLILLDANPLDDIANTQKRAGVVVNGQWFDAAAIQSRFSALRANATE